MDEETVLKTPSTATSMLKSAGESLISLRSIFSSKKIQPLDTEVVYGIEDIDKIKKEEKKPIIIVTEKEENVVIKESSRFMKFWTKMKETWNTRHEKEQKEDPDKVLKTKLRDLFIYVIFLILIIIISFGMSTSATFYYTTSLQNNILAYIMQNQTGNTFLSIACMADFWTYVEGPLMSSLYWTTWYNNPNNFSETKDLIYFEDKLVGLPRLRQLRVKSDSCLVPHFFQDITSCYSSYSKKDSDHTPFGLQNDTAWIYSEAVNGTSYSYTGYLATYESGGFVQPLSRDSETTSNILQYLQNNTWLDRQSRVVFLDYTIYNPNIDLFCIIKQVIEFPPSGGAISKIEIRTTKLLRYVNSFDYFVLVCEIIATILIFYYIIVEGLEFKKFGIRYLVDIWNLIDIFVVIISLSSILLNVYRCYLVNEHLSSQVLNNDEYINFDYASYWQKIYNQTICVNIFCSWIKIFRYIKFSKTMSLLSDTLAVSMKDLVGFMVMFLVVFVTFSAFAFLIFCTQISDYQSFDKSIFALFRIILGDFDFNAFYKANHILGPLFFVAYIFFVFFVLLSMFVAIINDSFMEVKEKISKYKDEFQIARFLKKQIFSRLRSDKIIKIQEILENSDLMNLEELTYHDWRKELSKYGYADVEIQALFMKYDEDGDRVLDYDERKRMFDDVKERRINVMDPLDDIECNNDADETEHMEDKKNFVTQTEMKDLVQRINSVESGLLEVVQKIDKVFECLAQAEQNKLRYQQKIRYTLEIISGSGTNFRM